MLKNDIAIKVSNLKKDFHLPHEKSSKSIKSAIVNIWRKKDKSIDTYHALRGISFEVKRGEFFGIVGRNGSGKSTLLKILAQIYQPTKGSVETSGKIVPFIELGVGFNPELSGRENVYLNGALLGFSRQEIDAKYDDIVKFAELEEFMDQKLKNYSSGMQVRLAFSVATRGNNADILLIDEVLAVGDADFQRKCYDYFKGLKKTDMTIVFITHDMSAVKQYCDSAILIEDGIVTNRGNVEDVTDSYLKLFNTSDSTKAVSKKESENRWGAGDVLIHDFDVKSDTKNIHLSFTLKASKDVEELVLGYNFIDGNSKLLMGGNTLNALGGRKLSIKQGHKLKVSFDVDNVLGSGTYNMNATVRSSDGSTIFDKWDNISKLEVAKSESYYPIIAPAKLFIASKDTHE